MVTTPLREVTDFSVIKSSSDSVAVCILSRLMFPDLVHGRIDADTLTIVNPSTGSGVLLVGLEDQMLEWLTSAPTVYLARVFDETASWSRIEMSREALTQETAGD